MVHVRRAAAVPDPGRVLTVREEFYVLAHPVRDPRHCAHKYYRRGNLPRGNKRTLLCVFCGTTAAEKRLDPPSPP